MDNLSTDRRTATKSFQGAENGSGFPERPLPIGENELWDFIEHAAVALRWMGEDGTILWANKAELRLLGYSRSEYVGHNIAEFHVDKAAIHDLLRRLKNDEPIDGWRARLRSKDGSIRHVSINTSVYRVSGRFIHTRCVTLDLSEQKSGAEAHQRLAAIVESSDDAIISKDLNGVIQSWNGGAQRIFGYTAEEIIGQHIMTLAAPGRADEIPDILGRLARGERVDHYETQRKTKDGRILNLSLTVSPIRDETGTIIGASKVARDITERRHHEEALRQVNAALSRSNADLQHFAYSASHDLQEPLRMVATYGELLQQDFAGKLGPAGDEYVSYIIRGALRLDQLLKDLRAYTVASTAGKTPAEELDANAILKKTLANLKVAMEESGASVTSDLLPRVYIPDFQLEQLFQNLIGNAIRYRGSEPVRIHVSAVLQENEWLFSVRDNGIGIDPRYREQIFELFARLHTVSEYPGTGLGLAICQRIVERAGGRIWVESEPGRGATFFFTIPRGTT
jgi:hypothetical protein